ncbi:MAG: flagellar hook assembly protein FlgD [Spirochaetaceae bacterium]|jgi:flagellar basal-body rod modification protein FlgD|nr:flagellar hook assembly protein FlgD [Spirochaetaceae bacterium]
MHEMELQAVLSSHEKAERAQWVQEHNSKINQGKEPQQALGKDDFLKILITQLSYQDPTAPMEDKEFIAQMAQFSTLDQMTSMATDFSRLASLVAGTEATSALGKSVEIAQGDSVIQGTVKAVTRGDNPEVLVQGSYYSWNQVTKVFEE